jgi:hypothetical protein
VASIGLSVHVIGSPTATAIVGSALASLAVCTLGVSRMARAAAATAGSGAAATATKTA